MDRFIVTSEGELNTTGIFEGDQPLEFMYSRIFETFEGVRGEG